MSDMDPLLQKADALMQRHRVYPGNTAPANGGDDIPVLTEVVSGNSGDGQRPSSTAGNAQVDPALIEQMVRERLDEVLPKLRRQLAEELDSWFDEQLPKIVMSLLDGFTDRLVGQIASQGARRSDDLVANRRRRDRHPAAQEVSDRRPV